MNYIITGKNFTSDLLGKFKTNPNYTLLSEEELSDSKIIFSDEDKIYCPDETSVAFLMPKMSKTRWEKLEIIKNKNQCRILLKDIYPDFYFKSINIEDLTKEKIPENKNFIIKPQKGFFGVGIREINSKSDLKKVAYNIQEEISNQVKLFSKDVFTAEDFIIEEFISGDEYSFDLYYNETAQPVITSFCHHPNSLHQEYFHLLYYTGEEIYNKFHDQVINIFKEFNKTLNIKNMPIHAEFKENNGKLVPIEFNVPRFGGFGLADLPYYAYGENSFEHFFENTKPDWKQIFTRNKDKNYAWVLCYNGTNIDLDNYEPNYNKLMADLGNIIHINKLDYTKNPVFAIAYIELENQEEINRILSLDFNNYFIPKHFSQKNLFEEKI